MRLNRAIAISPVILFAAAFPVSVFAQVTETSSIENTFSYALADQAGSGSNSGGAVELARRAVTGTGVSEMFLSLNGTLEDGSFLFLHSGTCVGVCSVTMTTDITFTLFNAGPDPVSLRFDSQITPGHLANSFLDPLSPSQASFDFRVSQDPGLRQGILYEANGDAVQVPPGLVTSDGQPFNFLTLDENSPDWTVLDWSATDLSIAMATIAPGETSNLYYSSTLTLSTTQPDCSDPTLCESFQVAFGDPRNSGGVLSASRGAMSALFADPFAASSAPNPAVGALFDPFRVTYSFVPVGSPLPGAPPGIGPIQYDINYRGVSAIPEPGTWLLMLLGFGAIGAILRRRGAEATFAT